MTSSVADAGHALVTRVGDDVNIDVAADTDTDTDTDVEALFAVTPTLEDVWNTQELSERRAAVLDALPSDVADAFTEWELAFEAPAATLSSEERIAELEAQLDALIAALGPM